jgi:23S rRNA (uracil1939-C5)-methyltransferase
MTTHTTPRCPHFGICGGCQHQELVYSEQLRIKRERLTQLLQDANVTTPAGIAVHSAEPYQYRNRIRLRIERIDGELHVGYNRPGTTDFLPITTCPIAAPALWHTAEALLAAAADRDVLYWFNAAAEVEIFCDDTASRIQLTLFCTPRTKAPPTSQPGNFTAAFATLQANMPQGITLAGAAAEAFDPRTGPTGRTLAEAGAPGLNYKVPVYAEFAETYWITRGGFFQINRFLIDTLVHLVCNGRSGALAWDLYAGVGLFSRLLARSFTQVTAVESNPSAALDLRNSLARLGPQHVTIESTTLAFLERAVLQRDRPDLIVLDPPRAGAGIEACALLARIAPQQIVYVSCDPTTLARDLAALQPHYRIAALNLLDLFPQTAHLETVAVLERIH